MVALVTPFKNGEVDKQALKRLVEFQILNGTSVLVPCGTTGESATLSVTEQEEVIRLVKEYAGGRAGILAGAGANSTAEAIELHKICERLGVDGALHVTPYYNKPSQDGLYAHYRALSESSPLPIVLYNVPGRTAVNLLPDTVLRLTEFKNIVGVKEASGSLVQASEILKSLSRADFGLYSGEDALTFALYALGAHGVISVTANVAPREMSEQYAAMVKGDFKTARELHYRLLDLHNAMFIETNPVPVKAALAMMGYIAEEYRLPLVPMSAKNRQKLQGVLEKKEN